MKRTTGAVLGLLLLAAGLAAWLLLRAGEERGAAQVLRAPAAAEPAAAPAFDETPAGEPRAADGAVPAPAPEAQPLAPTAVVTPDGRRKLAGHVLRAADRSPLANVALWVPSQPTAVTRSLADGAFWLDAVPADAELFVEAAHRQPLSFALPAAEAGVADIEVIVDTGWILPGTVLDADGRPLPGAQLVVADDRPWETELATSRDATSLSRAAVTGEHGAFRVLDIPYAPDGAGAPLRLHARARAAGHAAQQLEVDVPPGPQLAAPLEFRLQRGGAVAGHVVTRDGEPVVCGNVSLVYQATPDRAVFAPRGLSAESRGPDGAYRMEGVPPGRYVLAAWGGMAMGEGQSVYTGAPLFVADVEVRAGETSVVDIVLASDRVIEGVVVDATGNPVADVDVEARERIVVPGGNPSASSLIYHEGALRVVEAGAGPQIEIAHKLAAARTDGRGRFRFEALAPGGKQLIARKPSDPWLGWALRDVAVDQELPVEPVTLVLPRALRLAGRVLDEAGLPVAGAIVDNWSSSFPYENPASTTDAEGRFALAIEEPGPLSLGVEAEGFKASNVSLDLPRDRDDLLIRLAHSPAVRGVVLDSQTLQPVTSYGLVLLGRHSMIQTAVQSADGSFHREWGEEGTLSVSVTAEGYAAAEVAEVDPRKTVAEPLRVLLERD